MTEPKPIPSYAPVYAAALYPHLVGLFREHGYALAVHGSVQRDFDLIAVPWVEEASTPEVVIDSLRKEWSDLRVIADIARKPHGRIVYTISIGFGSCFMDLGFIPLITPECQTKESQ